MTTTLDLYSRLPAPDSVSVGGLNPGETPYVTLTYVLGRCDGVLEQLFGEVFGTAKAMSVDGTVKVRVE